MAGKGTCSLGKHHERHAFLQRLASLVVGGAYLRRATLVDKDMMCRLAGHAYERYTAQSFLHHPFEVSVQKTIDEENVERPLVVCHKHIRLSFVQMFAPNNRYWQQTQPHCEPRPPLARIVTPHVAIAKEAPYGGYQCRCNRQDEEEGQHYEQLIKAIEIFHCGFV